jgi:hypothetical protein
VAHAHGCATRQKAQVTALVAMVRETVSTIGGSQLDMSEALSGSAERVDKIARIASVADVFDALTSDRPYRLALSAHEGYDYIVTRCGIV